jgi:uracil-DNA glycosylase
MRSRLRENISTFVDRLQRLETLVEVLQASLVGHQEVNGRSTSDMPPPAAVLVIGKAPEDFANAMRHPVRGRAGCLARTRLAARLEERWPDGRFMSHADWRTLELKAADVVYMRHAAGGFARAALASRACDGTFLPGR